MISDLRHEHARINEDENEDENTNCVSHFRFRFRLRFKNHIQPDVIFLPILIDFGHNDILYLQNHQITTHQKLRTTQNSASNNG